MVLRIGNGAGFWGDSQDAAVRLAQAGELDFLTLEYLAELTMSILARLRQKNPQAGYATDFLQVLQRLVSSLHFQPQLHVVTNAGGMNPHACATEAAKLLAAQGLGDIKIATVAGDDILQQVEEIQKQGWAFENFDTGQPLAELKKPLVSANAYLGARLIADALSEQARVVITGRVADASLTLGPAMQRFGWGWNDWNRMAAASVAGHLIECGAQATGGLSHDWEKLELTHVGYPIAELEESGQCHITKLADTGGAVNRRTVIEQMVYEIGDPAQYFTPDVTVDFTTVEVSQAGPDRVKVSGASGKPATDYYKASLAYDDGFMASGQLLVYGKDCVRKARAAGAMVLERVEAAGFVLDEALVECMGAGVGVPGLHQPPDDLREVMLRITVRDARRTAVERFTRELAPLITSGPPGLAGYTASSSSVRPSFAYWPTLVPKSLIASQMEVRPASAWCEVSR